MFKGSLLASYFAGIATVVIALSAGFAGGALVGSSWGSIDRPPAVAPNEYRLIATVQKREIPLVQAVSQPPPDDQAIIAAQAKAIKAAAARKDAAEQRKIARAEQRKNAERRRQIALIDAARKMQASEVSSTKSEELKTSPSLTSPSLTSPSLTSPSLTSPSLGFAPQVHSTIVRE